MPKPNPKDAAALASVAGPASKAPEATPPLPEAVKRAAERRGRACVWTDDSQFNLAAWMAGKLRATVVAYDVPGVGKCELTLREPSGEDYREVDGMVARAVSERSLFSDGDVARFRNVALTAASLVAVNGKPWPDVKEQKEQAEGTKLPLSVKERLLRSSLSQTMLDLYVKATADFQAELLDLVRTVDPKLFASPSGSSEAPSPSEA